MPSTTSFPPYETLAFFQSIARHGSGLSALQDISKILTQNEHIRNHADYDADRLSSGSLKSLYSRYIGVQNVKANGSLETGERSPKRRRLSTSDKDGVDSIDEYHVQELVDLLYTTYKEDAIRSIQRDEEAFLSLQDDIGKLEQQMIVSTDQRPHVQKPAKDDQPGTDSQNVAGSRLLSQSSMTQSAAISVTPAIPEVSGRTGSQDRATNPLMVGELTARPLASSQQSRVSQTPATSRHPSPGSFTQQSSPSIQRPIHGPNLTQPMYPPGQAPSGQMIPQMTGAQRPHARSQQPGSHGRGSPVPAYQGQHSYPAYPQYHPPPPQWHAHMTPQPYQQHSPYGPPPQYYPPSNGRHPQTPQQVPYAAYPHTAPIHYMQQSQPQPQQWRGQQWPVQPSSATTTPISRPGSRLSMPGSGSSTPWKRKQQSSQLRHKSPSRPEREVSPLTDSERSPGRSKETKIEKQKAEDSVSAPRQSRRPGRPPSTTSSARAPSRSQSNASRTSDTQNEKPTSRRRQRIKAEPPSTPLPIPSSDTEQRSSGRRGRPRSTTVTSQIETLRSTNPKRKRESLSPKSRTQSPQPSLATPSSRRVDQFHDPSLVIVSKNFTKTSQLLLSEITSHKLAGIFAKPLSERDAPGYKDLVLRPQDLKSIKAAVSKGGRAALVAIEVMEGDQDITPIKNPPGPGLSTGSRAIGNGFYLVSKSSDLIPPKGIVNSAQLEMELMRMFANAIMFNPLPTSERGFGRALRFRKNGGDVRTTAHSGDTSPPSRSESGSVSGVDEGGIIADAREMFNDVSDIVTKWRELEGERMGTGTDTSVSRHGSLVLPSIPTADGGRHASMSASSNVGDEDLMVGESEAVSTPASNPVSGPGRKRRRIADH